eukprot:7381917-Prymnesium_polylepis.2
MMLTPQPMERMSASPRVTPCVCISPDASSSDIADVPLADGGDQGGAAPGPAPENLKPWFTAPSLVHSYCPTYRPFPVTYSQLKLVVAPPNDIHGGRPG